MAGLIDTHRHLGGSTSVQFVWDTIQSNGLKYLGENLEDVVKQMTLSPREMAELRPHQKFQRFLDKFRILDEIPWTEDLIDTSIKYVCQDLKNDNIDFCWMDFSINKYMSIGWHKKEAIRFIYDSFQRYYPDKVGLILSLKYESPRPSQRQYAALIEDPDVKDLLMGIDLVGDEGYYSIQFYRPIFAAWKKENKMLRAHVGESCGKENIKSAIMYLGVTNVAHGIKIFGDADLVKLARDRGISFDLAIDSNYYSGSWDGPHPIGWMINEGLAVTIGSDDPVQCSTTLSEQYNSLPNHGLTPKQIDSIRSCALYNTLKFCGAKLRSGALNPV